MAEPIPVLVVDDEDLIRWSLTEHLQQEGFQTLTARNGKEALDVVRQHAPALVLLDLKMPEMDGLTALRALREAGNDLPVIVITAHGGIEDAITATQLGSVGWLHKPFDLREVTLAVRRALEQDRLKREVHYLRGRDRQGYGEFVGAARTLDPVFETLKRLETVDAPTVLLTGESGTGKDVLARAIHARGPRRDQVFMEIDCASLPENLIESELFGHERGSFTDARSTKRGLFELADGGVVFLDEIGELGIGVQAKLLRALETRAFKRVGGTSKLRMDVAMIAATNRDLRAEVAAGRFREDLYFRLDVVPLHIPPLRERSSDIAGLVEHFVERVGRALGKKVQGVSSEAMERLVGWHWPGNVRELRNVIERMLILGDSDIIGVGDLPSEIRWARTPTGHGHGCPFTLPDGGVDLEQVERGLLLQALERTQGNQSAAARLLGVSRYALRYRMEKFELGGAA